MNRCQPKRAPIALAALLSFTALGSLLPLPAAAQISVQRQAPKGVVLARMTVVTPPAIRIDGKDDRLSPGAHIHDTKNMLVLSGQLVGATVPVVYRRDVTGAVHEVWLLTEDEYKKLGGAGPAGTPEGVQQFLDFLAAIWASRR